MVKKGGNFIEEHIEKLVLVIAALACIYPFYKYVISSPKFELDGSEFQPGQLDIHISERAEQLKEQLNRAPEPKDYNEPCSPVFIAKLEETWSVGTKITWPLPFSVEQKINKKYRMPAIGQVKDVEAEHIRAAAYVPKVAVTQENVNVQETYEPNDIDLVTVQGSIDVAGIVDGFEECFAGKEVPEGWRDVSLARPVFAAVQLQRQRLGTEGRWSEWEEVSPAKIEVQREEFSVVEDVKGLPSGGVLIRRLRLGDPQTQAHLLQPEPYQIASAEEMWFPPVLHRKFLTIQREKEAQERRESIAAGREEQTEERERVRTDGRERVRTDERDRGRTERDSRTRTTRETPSSGTSGRSGERGEAGGGSRGTTRTARPERERPVVQPAPEQVSKTAKPVDDSEIYNELDKMLLREKDIGALREPVVIWAHDDTVEPGNSYRYRVRVGVFNPVAGTGQVRAEDASYEDKVILWSDFSDVTATVAIPLRVYFFPLGVQETAKAADVQVCRYALGYWYSEQFMVKRGEEIGKSVKVEPDKQNQRTRTEQEQMQMQVQGQEATLPDMIDYTTGAVLVDLVAINDWSGSKNLQQRQYFDMLYSFDGLGIERIAAKLMYWPDDVRAKYSEIKSLEKKPKVAFREWNGAGAFGGQRGPRGPQMRAPTGRGVEDPRMEEMMRMRMGQPQRP